MRIEEELLIRKRRVYVQYLGKINLNMYNEFETRTEGLDFWWAAAKCADTFVCMIYQGMDGLLANDHLKERAIQNNLEEKVKAFIQENDELSLDAISKQERMYRECRP
jgi:hypothetical protein